MEENKERKRVKLKLEFYEDELEEFLGLVYLIKKNLTEDSIEGVYYDFKPTFSDELEIESSKNKSEDDLQKTTLDKEGSPKEKEQKPWPRAINRESQEFKAVKPYLKFIRYIVSHFYVETLDSDNPNIAKGVLGFSEENLNNEKYLEDPWFEQIFEFLIEGDTIKEIFTPKRIKELACFILFAKDFYKPRIEIIDQYWAAASRYKEKFELPYELKVFLSTERLFFFRRDVQVSYNEEMKKDDRYYLAYRIYKRLFFLFPEFQTEEKAYQAKVITGYILQFLGFSIINEDAHYSKPSSKKVKSYREYLWARADYWINRGMEVAKTNNW